MLFLYCPCILWPTPGLPGVLAACADSSERSIRSVQLALAGGHPGFGLCPLDIIDVRADLPVERLGLDLARARGYGRRRQLHRRLPQSPAGALLSGNCAVNQEDTHLSLKLGVFGRQSPPKHTHITTTAND